MATRSLRVARNEASAISDSVVDRERSSAKRCGMKQVVAIVKPFLVEKILDALRRAPLEAVSVAEVKGMGKQKSYLDRYADSEYAHTFLPKVEITLWVDDLRAEEVARKIVEVARTGRMGDGKIFILSAEPHEAIVG